MQLTWRIIRCCFLDRNRFFDICTLQRKICQNSEVMVGRHKKRQCLLEDNQTSRWEKSTPVILTRPNYARIRVQLNREVNLLTAFRKRCTSVLELVLALPLCEAIGTLLVSVDRDMHRYNTSATVLNLPIFEMVNSISVSLYANYPSND